ncbi:MAG: ATP-binding protein, partial [Gammaproteobacteria bacterium]|nr:ATP-binding protein [Gammaproteobacteria bacterium]
MQRNSFYFSGGPYQQLLQGMHDALSMPEAFIKLMGPAHTGKTTLCDKLVQYMRRKGFRVVHFDYAIESPEMLRTMLARELDLPNLANFARVLEDALIDDHDKPLLLIFDDAHLLSDISLIEVYRLAEVQTGSRRMLNIVLCGDTSLESRLLSNSEFKSLLLHVSHKFYLEPMDPETLSLFFVTYLEKAGMPGIQLEPKAMNYFYKSCKGYPQPAAAICRLIVESRTGQSELLPITRIELANLIKAAAADENLPSRGFRDNNQLIVFGPVFAVLAIASLGFLYQQINTPGEITSENQLIARQDQTSSAEVFDNQSIVNVEQTVPSQQQRQAAESPQANLENFAEEPVSDSNLALVTAAERGVSVDDIVEPEYEALTVGLEAESSLDNEQDNPVAEVPRPRVLTLEEEDSPDSAIVLSPPEFAADNSDAVLNETINSEQAAREEVLAEITEEELAAGIIASSDMTILTAGEDESVLEDFPNRVEASIDIGNSADEGLADLSADIEPELLEEESESAVVLAIQLTVESWIAAWQSQMLADYFFTTMTNSRLATR